MGLAGGRQGATSVFASDDPARLIIETLRVNGGEMLATASDLHVHRSTLYDYVKRLGLWPAVNAVRREATAKRKRRRRRGLSPE